MLATRVHRRLGLLLAAALCWQVAASGGVGPAVAAPFAAPAAPLAAPAATPAPVVPVTFGLQAAQANRLDNRAYLSYGVTPGAVISDHVAIENFSAKALNLYVYATDAQAGADGGITFKAGGIQPTDAGAWFTVAGRGTVRVPARTKVGVPGAVIVPIRLTVPQSATPGDHVAAIIASLVVQATQNGTPVRLDQRVAERAYIRVAGTLRPQLRIEALRLHYNQSLNPFGNVTARVTYVVHNTGNVLLSANQSIALSGLLGNAVRGPALPALTRLLPGASTMVTATITHVSPGMRLSATVTLRPAPALDGNVDGSLPPVRRSTSSWAWALTLLILVGLFVVGFWIWRRYWPYAGPIDPAGADPANSREPAGAT